MKKIHFTSAFFNEAGFSAPSDDEKANRKVAQRTYATWSRFTDTDSCQKKSHK